MTVMPLAEAALPAEVAALRHLRLESGTVERLRHEALTVPPRLGRRVWRLSERGMAHVVAASVLPGGPGGRAGLVGVDQALT